MKKLSEVVPMDKLGAVAAGLTSERDVRLTLKLELKGKSVGWIEMELRAKDLELPFDEFSKRYLQPAFAQAKSRAEQYAETHATRR